MSTTQHFALAGQPAPLVHGATVDTAESIGRVVRMVDGSLRSTLVATPRVWRVQLGPLTEAEFIQLTDAAPDGSVRVLSGLILGGAGLLAVPVEVVHEGADYVRTGPATNLRILRLSLVQADAVGFLAGDGTVSYPDEAGAGRPGNRWGRDPMGAGAPGPGREFDPGNGTDDMTPPPATQTPTGPVQPGVVVTNLGPDGLLHGGVAYLATSAFSAPAGWHAASRWQLATDPSFATVVIDTGWTTSGLLERAMAGLRPGTTYFARAAQRSNLGEMSPWSVPTHFATAPIAVPVDPEEWNPDDPDPGTEWGSEGVGGGGETGGVGGGRDEEPTPAAPIAAFRVMPARRGDIGTTFLFDGSPSVALPGATYEWDFGDGNSATGLTAAHQYSRPGNYTARLTVGDANGRDEVTHTIEIVRSIAPVADFVITPAGAGTVDTVWRFDASGSRGVALRYAWSFGDGTTLELDAENRVVAHQYASVGTFLITLTVSDNWGHTAEISRTLEVGGVVAPDDPLAAAFEASAEYGFVGDEVDFDSSMSRGRITARAWSFGDNPATPTPPGVPIVSVPAVGSTAAWLRTSRFATAVAGATHQSTRWLVATDPAMQIVAVDSGYHAGALTSITIDGLAADTQYYLRAAHRDSGGREAWSPAVAFTTKADGATLPPPQTPSVAVSSYYARAVVLAGGAFSVAGGVAHAASQWQVSTSSGFGSTLLDTGLCEHLRSLPVAGLSPSTAMFARVRYLSADNVLSAWSQPVAFTTRAEGEALPPGYPDAPMLPVGVSGPAVGVPADVAQGVKVSHVFTLAGEFRVELTVTGEDGRTMKAEKIVRIEDGNLPPNTPTANSDHVSWQGARLKSSAFADPNAASSHARTHWQLSKSATFNTTVLNVDSATQLYEVQVWGLDPETTYYLRVAHRDSGGLWSPWSQTHEFTTRAPSQSEWAAPPDRPSLSVRDRASNGARLSGSGYRDPNDDRHHSTVWQLSSRSDFAGALILNVRSTQHLVSYQLSGLQPETVYFARIAYFDVTGMMSEWSEVVEFQTKAAGEPADDDGPDAPESDGTPGSGGEDDGEGGKNGKEPEPDKPDDDDEEVPPDNPTGPRRPEIEVANRADNGKVVGGMVRLVSSPFKDMDPAAGHYASRWQLATDKAFTQIAFDSEWDVENLIQREIRKLKINTQYWARVAHKSSMVGSSGGARLISQWSIPAEFTTGTADEEADASEIWRKHAGKVGCAWDRRFHVSLNDAGSVRHILDARPELHGVAPALLSGDLMTAPAFNLPRKVPGQPLQTTNPARVEFRGGHALRTPTGSYLPAKFKEVVYLVTVARGLAGMPTVFCEIASISGEKGGLVVSHRSEDDTVRATTRDKDLEEEYVEQDGSHWLEAPGDGTRILHAYRDKSNVGTFVSTAVQDEWIDKSIDAKSIAANDMRVSVGGLAAHMDWCATLLYTSKPTADELLEIESWAEAKHSATLEVPSTAPQVPARPSFTIGAVQARQVQVTSGAYSSPVNSPHLSNRWKVTEGEAPDPNAPAVFEIDTVPGYTNVPLTGLTPNRGYWIWLRHIDDDLRESEWSEPQTITTLHALDAVVEGLVFADDFDRANGPLGNGWTVSGSMAIDDNAASASPTAGSASAIAPGGTLGAGVAEARLRVRSLPVGTYYTFGGVLLRRPATPTRFYWARLSRAEDGSRFVHLLRNVGNGTEFVATVSNNWAANTWHTLRLEVGPGVQRVWLNNALVIEASDTGLDNVEGPAWIHCGTNPGSGITHDFDRFAWWRGRNVSCENLPTGYKLRVLGQTIAADANGNATCTPAGTAPWPALAQVLDAGNNVIISREVYGGTHLRFEH